MKLILTGLLIFYALILITRYVGPILLKLFLKRLSKKFGMPEEDLSKPYENAKTSKKKAKQSKPIVGEYIDFEEID